MGQAALIGRASADVTGIHHSSSSLHGNRHILGIFWPGGGELRFIAWHQVPDPVEIALAGNLATACLASSDELRFQTADDLTCLLAGGRPVVGATPAGWALAGD